MGAVTQVQGCDARNMNGKANAARALDDGFKNGPIAVIFRQQRQTRGFAPRTRLVECAGRRVRLRLAIRPGLGGPALPAVSFVQLRDLKCGRSLTLTDE